MIKESTANWFCLKLATDDLSWEKCSALPYLSNTQIDLLDVEIEGRILSRLKDGKVRRCIDSSGGSSGLGESECGYPCFSGASNWLGCNNEYRRVTSIGHVSRWLRAAPCRSWCNVRRICCTHAARRVRSRRSPHSESVVNFNTLQSLNRIPSAPRCHVARIVQLSWLATRDSRLATRDWLARRCTACVLSLVTFVFLHFSSSVVENLFPFSFFGLPLPFHSYCHTCIAGKKLFAWNAAEIPSSSASSSEFQLLSTIVTSNYLHRIC